jgi:hypothetical protein
MKYQITYLGTIDVSATATIEADSEDDARAKAEAHLDKNRDRLDWEHSFEVDNIEWEVSSDG